MDNTVPLISSLAALSVIGILAFQCMHNNVESFESPDAAVQRADMRTKATVHGSSINQALDDVKFPNQDNLDRAANTNGFEASPQQLSPSIMYGTLTPPVSSDLLPRTNDNNSSLDNINSESDGLPLLNFSIGMSTSTLRNTSLDIRGDPSCNPTEPVSAFNNSSITCTLTRPLTCYDDSLRPDIYSCDWNRDWWNGKQNVPGVSPSEM